MWQLWGEYNGEEGLDMGLVNSVVGLEEVEEERVKWCKEMMEE